MEIKSVRSRIKNPLGKLFWDLFMIFGGIFGIFYHWKENHWLVYILFFTLGSLVYWTLCEDLVDYLKNREDKPSNAQEINKPTKEEKD